MYLHSKKELLLSERNYFLDTEQKKVGKQGQNQNFMCFLPCSTVGTEKKTNQKKLQRTVQRIYNYPIDS